MTSRDVDAPRIGDAAPPLFGPTIEDDTFELAALCGQPVLVSFLRHAG